MSPACSPARSAGGLGQGQGRVSAQQPLGKLPQEVLGLTSELATQGEGNLSGFYFKRPFNLGTIGAFSKCGETPRAPWAGGTPTPGAQRGEQTHRETPGASRPRAASTISTDD